MGCEKTLNLDLTVSGEFPMDSAVYVSSVDKIFGCHGAYIHQCNATSGARESSVKVASPMMGNSCIAYHAANSRLYLGGWFDPSWIDQSASLASPRADLWPVNPADLSVGSSIGLPAAFSALNPPSNRFGMSGVHTLLSSGSYLYFLYRYQGGGGQPFRINPLNLAQKNTNSSAGWSNWNSWQTSIDGSFFYFADPDYAIFKAPLDFTGIVGLWNKVDVNNDNECPVAVEVIGSNVYAVCGNGTLVKATSFDPGGPGVYTTFNLELIQADVKPFKLRYNSVDGLLYIPCQQQDVVIVWNPGTDTGVLKTGFDGPCDVVFTATKKFAVQSGPTGLREIT